MILHIYCMNFREFCEAHETRFTIEGIYVTISEIALEEYENVLLEDISASFLKTIHDKVYKFAKNIENKYKYQLPPAPPEKLKKFRVKLRYPKSKKEARLGHYRPDTMYVYATSMADAKKKAEEYIRTKLEPVENDETKHYRFNYLKDVKKKHLNMNVKHVKDWNDLVATLKHVANNRGDLTPLDYFDE